MKANRLVFIVILFVFWGCNKSQKKNDLLEIANIESLNRYIEFCWNKRDTIQFLSMASNDFYRIVNGIKVVSNSNEMEAHINVYKTAFPDLKVTITETIISNNMISTLWDLTGTNTGIYGETIATGKKISISGSSILYFTNDNKLLGEKIQYNELDLLQQLGYTINSPIVE
jgi:predicted ester cyclase